MTEHGPDQPIENATSQAAIEAGQGQALDPPLWLVILSPEQEAALIAEAAAEAQAERELEL